uniref:PDZ domain-containing protein n=1 Tax=Hyaloperonospora arabidopsidis (strain Emoy2) TaxID=559515 RepID=M4B6Q6_HYAAE
MKVTVANGSTYPAVIHSADPLSDIALLQIQSDEVEEWPMISIGSSTELRAGEWVCALGSPFSLQNSVSAGIISAVARHSSELGYPQRGGEYIQTDAAINAGNSGGPLINLDGKVIGINTMKVDGSVGISFAIPADTAVEVIQQLCKHKKVVRPYIGMQMINFNARELREIGRMFPGVKEGVIVKSVVPGSPAHKGGLLPGDVIVSFDGKKVLSTKDILTTVGYNIGRHIPVQVKRREEKDLVKLQVTTEPLPAPVQQFRG